MKIDDMRSSTGKDSVPPEEWFHADFPLWKTYMNSYIEEEKRLEIHDKLDERVPAALKHFPNLKSTEEIHPPNYCFPSNIFDLNGQTQLPERLNRNEKRRIWRNMKTDPEIDMSSIKHEITQRVKRTDSAKWAGVWPCIEHDIATEMRQMAILKKRKLRDLFSCQDDPTNNCDPGKSHDDFTDHRELGHARIPKFCVSLKELLVVERSCGDKTGLVDGDYINYEFTSENEKEKRVHTAVCLRGMKGMHLIELNSMRARKKTWKFCLYQALVALLAKTQLRYKYASGINIDYIYDHAWMLYIHMGNINIKKEHSFDDVVVYNYKYSVELELVEELKDVPRISVVNWKYTGKNLKTMRQLKRPELMKTTEQLDWEKIKHPDEMPVHEKSEEIEKWFDKLLDRYRDCIFRTCRFSLAFWNEGNFWYLYNPYRSDQYGFWDDDGYACIMKFCTRITLRRHLMILLLNAYVYEPFNSFENDESREKYGKNFSGEDDTITIQIFRVIYHCVKIHDLKLLQRKPPKRQMQKIWKDIDDCNYDPFTLKDKSMIDCNEIMDDTTTEKTSWLKDFKITWTQTQILKKPNAEGEAYVVEKIRWHEYHVEKVGKLFSLWGEIHPTAEIFAKQNRGRQTYACYVVCAGMTRIMAPEYWNSKILDAIVMCGDRYYTLSRLQSEATASENVTTNMLAWSPNLIRHFNIGDILFEVDVLAPICGELYTKVSLWKTLEQMFLKNTLGILMCENTCLGLFKFCGAYYMLDVNSMGPPIFNLSEGAAFLLRATSFHEFILTLILTIGSIECSSFVLNPIDIVNIIDVSSAQNKSAVNQKKNSDHDGLYEKDPRNKPKKIILRNKKSDRRTCKSS